MKETVKSDLGSKVGKTGDADKGPRRELCGIATIISGDGALRREFSEDDESNDLAGRRRSIVVTVDLICVTATRVW